MSLFVNHLFVPLCMIFVMTPRQLTLVSAQYSLTILGPSRPLESFPQQQSQSKDSQVLQIPSFYPTFEYTLEFTKPLKRITTTELNTCGYELFPGYVTFLKRINLLTFGEQRHIQLLPKTPTTPAYLDIAICNPFQDACQACMLGDTGYEATLMIYRNPDVGLQFTKKCAFFTQKDCGVRSCNKGQFASNYLSMDENGFVLSNTKCLPCAPGTWMTCINDANCAYTIPTSPGGFEGGGAFYHPHGVDPVGACYDCAYAGGQKIHYGQTSRKTIIEASATEPLPWYCPGGDSPPIPCSFPYAGANENGTGCICREGYFPVNSDMKCQLCPPGTMCPKGEKIVCPDDTFQNNAGATSCEPCLGYDGQPLFCQIPGKKMRKCNGRFKSEIPLCVGCNQCKHPYDLLSPGSIECY